MRLLAIETSTEACSVALRHDDDVFENHVVRPREHTRILLPMIRGLLAEAGVAIADLDAVVLGNGPGSFIGMRIGASVAQGICFGAGIKIAPVSSLAAIATEVIESNEANAVVVAQDARMNEVYVGQFQRGDDGTVYSACEELIQPVGLLELSLQGALAAGAAWQKYEQLVAANRPQLAGICEIAYPRAQYLLAAGVRLMDTDGLIEPELLMPAYLRNVVAKVPAGDRLS